MPVVTCQNTTIACASMLSLLLVSGCASQHSATATPSEAELCAKFKDVIAQSDTQFRKFKSTPTISPFSGMTKWETRPVFPESSCDVLEWVGGRTNYVCTWPEGTEAQARETQTRTSARIGACLGPEWTRSDTMGQTGGAATFTSAATQAQVVMRYFQPRRGFGSGWETSLTIGDDLSTAPR